MPVTKSALIRYKILDKCFANTGRKYFIEDLIEECNKALLEIDEESEGISRRTILNDIKFMQSKEGWSIELGENKFGKRRFYRYTDPKFSINNSKLTEYEINQLKGAMDIIGHFKGMPQFEFVNELLPKLHQGTFIDNNQKAIISFDTNEYLKGMHHFNDLYNAVLYKKVLHIEYLPYDADKPEFFKIHPYYLKQYNNRWFLFGLNEDADKQDWNLAIDRIQAIKEIKGKYKPTDIDWNEYFDDMIGVTKLENAKIEKVILEVYGKTGNYFITKPLHNSQKPFQRIDKNTIRIELNVILNYELERLILSYAESMKVIEPKSLSKTIAKRLEKGCQMYLN